MKNAEIQLLILRWVKLVTCPTVEHELSLSRRRFALGGKGRKALNAHLSTTRLSVFLLVIVLLLTAAMAGFQREISAQGTRWLAKYQNPDEGGWLWHGVEPDGVTIWGWDLNGDNRFEKHKWIVEAPQKPQLEVFVWDRDQNGRPEGYAWAENACWIESVWDANGDGAYERWGSYVGMQGCNLVGLRNNFQTKYREHLDAQRTGNALLIRRAYLEYQRASLTFNACRAMTGAGE
jgi:hypothetical protein